MLVICSCAEQDRRIVRIEGQHVCIEPMSIDGQEQDVFEVVYAAGYFACREIGDIGALEVSSILRDAPALVLIADQPDALARKYIIKGNRYGKFLLVSCAAAEAELKRQDSWSGARRVNNACKRLEKKYFS
jgi:hypothetical protein